jgi:hypothetical protein
MKKTSVLVVCLSALMGVVPAADAKAKKKPPPKPAYDFIYQRTKTTVSVARCPIVTGGFTTVTHTDRETLFQTGRVNGRMYEKGSSVVDVKQEVENSEYVFPFDDPGVPLEWDNATAASSVASVRNGKMTFLYSGAEHDGKLKFKLPAKGKQVHKPLSMKVEDDAVEEDGCTRTRTVEFAAGLIVTPRH